MLDFIVYTEGFCYASVCTTLPREEVADRMNRTRPTGLKHPWAVADEPFRTGEPNPCPCDQNPETRSHYLMVC